MLNLHGLARRPVSDPEQLWRYPEAARFLGISRGTLQAWVCQGKYGIPFLKIGTKLVRFRKSDLVAWMAKRQRGCGE